MIPKANVSISELDNIHRNSASHKMIKQLFKATNFSPRVIPFQILSFLCFLSLCLSDTTTTTSEVIMLKQESNWTQVCNTCRSAVCTVYYRADSAYLCTTCDAQAHLANRLVSRHERVRVCESCERAPAAFFCKADAASLCIACDSQVHSANPLAGPHQRVPILSIFSKSYSSMATNRSSEVVSQEEEDEDEAELASWLLPSSDYNVPQRYAGDEVVPLEVEETKRHMHHGKYDFQFGFTNVSSGYHMVSLGPETRTSDTTVSHKAAIDQLPDPPTKILSPVDREARVMRYREKKKRRKFEKRVRYASRKAYAETRPRIKGRFVKREEEDAKADQGFSTVIMFDTGYGIVPSF